MGNDLGVVNVHIGVVPVRTHIGVHNDWGVPLDFNWGRIADHDGCETFLGRGYVRIDTDPIVDDDVGVVGHRIPFVVGYGTGGPVAVLDVPRLFGLARHEHVRLGHGHDVGVVGLGRRVGKVTAIANGDHGGFTLGKVALDIGCHETVTGLERAVFIRGPDMGVFPGLSVLVPTVLTFIIWVGNWTLPMALVVKGPRRVWLGWRIVLPVWVVDVSLTDLICGSMNPYPTEVGFTPPFTFRNNNP